MTAPVHWQHPGRPPGAAACHGKRTTALITSSRAWVTCGSCRQSRSWLATARAERTPATANLDARWYRANRLPVPATVETLARDYERNRSRRRRVILVPAAVPAILAPEPVPLPARPSGCAAREWAQFAAPVMADDPDPWYGLFCAPPGWDRLRALEAEDADWLAGWGRWFTARHHGTCAGDCDDRDIRPGDRIRADGHGGYLCETCGSEGGTP